MSRNSKPRGMSEPDNPEWTAADFKRARPAQEVVPHIVDAYLRKLGRPPMGDTPKVQVTLRLDPAVIAYFKKAGNSWQTRINEALVATMPKPPKRTRVATRKR